MALGCLSGSKPSTIRAIADFIWFTSSGVKTPSTRTNPFWANNCASASLAGSSCGNGTLGIGQLERVILELVVNDQSLEDGISLGECSTLGRNFTIFGVLSMRHQSLLSVADWDDLELINNLLIS